MCFISTYMQCTHCWVDTRKYVQLRGCRVSQLFFFLRRGRGGGVCYWGLTYCTYFWDFFVWGGGGIKLVPVKFIICTCFPYRFPGFRSKGLGILEKLKIPEAYKIQYLIWTFFLCDHSLEYCINNTHYSHPSYNKQISLHIVNTIKIAIYGKKLAYCRVWKCKCIWPQPTLLRPQPTLHQTPANPPSERLCLRAAILVGSLYLPLPSPPGW
jgi:hypothetical protein